MPAYPINFTNVVPATETLRLSRRVASMESPHSLKAQHVITASQWILEWSWPRMTPAKASVVNAWINSLRGPVGSFVYQPKQIAMTLRTGLSLASAAFAYNNAIVIGGFGANGSTQIKLGQYLRLGNQLLQITTAPDFANVSGNATFEIEPSLRVNLASGTSCNFASPTGIFRLAASEGLGSTMDPDKLPEFGFISAREVI